MIAWNYANSSAFLFLPFQAVRFCGFVYPFNEHAPKWWNSTQSFVRSFKIQMRQWNSLCQAKNYRFDKINKIKLQPIMMHFEMWLPMLKPFHKIVQKKWPATIYCILFSKQISRRIFDRCNRMRLQWNIVIKACFQVFTMWKIIDVYVAWIGWPHRMVSSLVCLSERKWSDLRYHRRSIYIIRIVHSYGMVRWN